MVRRSRPDNNEEENAALPCKRPRFSFSRTFQHHLTSRDAFTYRRSLYSFYWLLQTQGRPSLIDSYLKKHQGLILKLPWPEHWRLELHRDPYHDARAATMWGRTRWGWPSRHVVVGPRGLRERGKRHNVLTFFHPFDRKQKKR